MKEVKGILLEKAFSCRNKSAERWREMALWIFFTALHREYVSSAMQPYHFSLFEKRHSYLVNSNMLCNAQNLKNEWNMFVTSPHTLIWSYLPYHYLSHGGYNNTLKYQRICYSSASDSRIPSHEACARIASHCTLLCSNPYRLMSLDRRLVFVKRRQNKVTTCMPWIHLPYNAPNLTLQSMPTQRITTDW